MINSEPTIMYGLIILAIALFIFWIWALIDMLSSRRIRKLEKGIWFILFFVASFITMIVWAIVRKSRRRGKRR